MKQLPTDTMGQRIKAKRKMIKGMTQDVLAKKIGKSRHSVTMLELDKASCSLETLCDIADVLNTTTDYLLGRGPDLDDIKVFLDLMHLLPVETKSHMMKYSESLVTLLNGIVKGG